MKMHAFARHKIISKDLKAMKNAPFRSLDLFEISAPIALSLSQQMEINFLPSKSNASSSELNAWIVYIARHT